MRVSCNDFKKIKSPDPAKPPDLGLPLKQNLVRLNDVQQILLFHRTVELHCACFRSYFQSIHPCSFSHIGERSICRICALQCAIPSQGQNSICIRSGDGWQLYTTGYRNEHQSIHVHSSSSTSEADCVHSAQCHCHSGVRIALSVHFVEQCCSPISGCCSGECSQLFQGLVWQSCVTGYQLQCSVWSIAT